MRAGGSQQPGSAPVFLQWRALALFSTAVTATVVAGIAATAASAQPAAAVTAGTYTEEQAVRGQALYYQHCLNCHGEMLGGVDKAPPLAGPQFTSVWQGEPLWALVERLNTMPPDKPGSLSRADNVDLLAYLLWYNGLPIGTTALAAEQAALQQMTFQAPTPGE